MKWILMTFFVTFNFAVFGQQFSGTPPSVKWKQINSDTVRIIFPPGLDSQAQRIAAIIHHMAKDNPVSLGTEMHKINVVLQNLTTLSNGYVQLAPFRSEFFLTPFPNNFDLGSLPWHETLAIHEYRHVQQFNNFRNGVSKALYFLLGEEGLVVATGASMPDWFFEGDAVYAETLLTSQGRGRLPFFLNQYRALWNEGKNYSWMKLRNGSLRDFIPSHYNMGFLLVNYGYSKYGPDFWKKVTKDASAFKGLFYPFQKAIRRHAQVDYATFRKDALAYNKEQLGNHNPVDLHLIHQNRTNDSLALTITSRENYVVDHTFPYQANSEIIYAKESYRRVAGFYKMKNATEEKIRAMDIRFTNQFSYRNGLIAYSAYKPDIRWGWRDYSDIRIVNAATGEQRKLTRKTKYFSPDISPSGQFVAAVNQSVEGNSELHILDIKNGKIISAIKSSDIAVYTDPKFITDTSLVVAVRLIQGRMALALVNTVFGSSERLTPLSFNVVGNPYYENDHIYFTASYEGNDDLYTLRLSDKKIFKLITGDLLGKYFVNANGNALVYSTFTAHGYQLRMADVKKLQWQEVNLLALQETRSPIPIAAEQLTRDVLQTTAPRDFSVSDYRKSTGLINFHSWRPFYEDPEFSFSIYSDNVLNTFSNEIYYRYNTNEDEHSVGVRSVFGGLFPLISGGVDYTFNRIIDTPFRQFNQFDIIGGVNIPLNFTGGKFYRFLNGGSSFVHRNQINRSISNTLPDVDYNYLSHFISYVHQLQKARQHIFPRFAFSGNLNHRHAITRYESFQFLANNNIYLPGLHVNHNLQFSGSFQVTDTLNPGLFSNRFVNARGYENFYFTKMWKGGANYHFPLFYPDWGFANFVYFMRIRANVFYDHSRVFNRARTLNRDFRSVGSEIVFDTKWWNQLPASIGVRWSHLLDDDVVGRRKGSNVFEVFVPFSIIPD